MIREQDLNLALLRASLGTTAQHDPSLSHLRFSLPSGPLRPLLPSLATVRNPSSSFTEQATFDDLLLGTPLSLSYLISWPLDLFLPSSSIQIYSHIFNYLSSLRKTHTRIHTCWTSLSNAQRARRRWTGLGEGGTEEDVEVRKGLARVGWGVVRDMGWFLDTLLGYVMTDVVDVEFRRLKDQLAKSGNSEGSMQGRATPLPPPTQAHGQGPQGPTSHATFPDLGGTTSTTATHLDFTTLRNIHNTYLERLLTGSLLSNPALTSILRPIFEVCERFVAQVERWGGDVLPALLSEGSLGGEGSVGETVKERWSVVAEINEVLFPESCRIDLYTYIFCRFYIFF
jgi:gamma-tubulin complex component 4